MAKLKEVKYSELGAIGAPVLIGTFEGCLLEPWGFTGKDGKKMNGKNCRVSLNCGVFPSVRSVIATFGAYDEGQHAEMCAMRFDGVPQGAVVAVAVREYTLGKGVPECRADDLLLVK